MSARRRNPNASDKPDIQPDKTTKGKSSEDVNKSKVSNLIHYEFGGPIGAAGIVFGLPLVVLGLFYACNKNVCVTSSPFSFNWTAAKSAFSTSITDIISMEALICYFGWMVFHVVLERILPGEQVLGVSLSNGARLQYTMSGHLQFWLTILVMGHASPWISESPVGSSIYVIKGFFPLRLDLVYNHYVQLIFVSTIGAYALSIYL